MLQDDEAKGTPEELAEWDRITKQMARTAPKITAPVSVNSIEWVDDWKRRVNEASDKYGLALEARKASEKLCALLQMELLLLYRENETEESSTGGDQRRIPETKL